MKNSNSPKKSDQEIVVEMLIKFYAVMGNAPEARGAMNLMAIRIQERGISLEGLEAALTRCENECVFPVRLPHILQRVPGTGTDDGRPEPETAWAMCPKSEEASVIWTQEMEAAFDSARGLLADGEAISARMAFKEDYSKRIAKAREERLPVRWIVSLGWNKADRVRALSEGVAKNRISAKKALELAGDQFESLCLALPQLERSRLQLTGEVKQDVKLELPGMPGVLKMLSDAKKLPAVLEPKKKRRFPPKQSVEQQLAEVRNMEIAGKISKEQAEKMKKGIEAVASHPAFKESK